MSKLRTQIDYIRHTEECFHESECCICGETNRVLDFFKEKMNEVIGEDEEYYESPHPFGQIGNNLEKYRKEQRNQLRLEQRAKVKEL